MAEPSDLDPAFGWCGCHWVDEYVRASCRLHWALLEENQFVDSFGCCEDCRPGYVARMLKERAHGDA